MERVKQKIPVTVLVGFLGAGKTTLLNHLLSEKGDMRIACIVNDFSKLNIDKDLVVNTTENVIEMSNGCICCTLRGDLLKSLQDIAKRDDVDYVIIESTGIGEPLPIAQTFYMENLPDLYELDGIVTVVDSSSFWKTYERIDQIEDAEGNLIESPLAPLLIDQLEFTNIIILNKTDLADKKQLGLLDGYCRGLNPQARVLRATNAKVNRKDILGVKLYDYDTGMKAKKWDDEWAKASSEVEEYGFNNYVFASDKTFSRKKFNEIFEIWPDNVLRAKGYIRFEDGLAAFISFAGSEIEIQEIRQRKGAAEIDTEIVFIGVKVKKEEIDELLQRVEV
jgi:G3E family GTPase